MKDVRAKKHLGQHFLNDETIAFNITKLLNNNTRNVVEPYKINRVRAAIIATVATAIAIFFLD